MTFDLPGIKAKLGGGFRALSRRKNQRVCTHHKLLCKLVESKLVALRVQRGGDRLPLQHHRLS